MAVAGQIGSGQPRSIPSLRWWIGGILFASTVINYIDRQTLSILAPYLKQDYHWRNVDYANIAIAFRIAYTIGQTLCGRLMDRVGTRRGLTISVTRYSIVSLLTSLANGLSSFAVWSFLLGAGEAVTAGKSRLRLRELLKLPQTWGTIISKGLTDPVWFFVTDWFPIYLVAKGISLRSGLLAVWIPFLAADLGNFFGGGASGYLIRRGWPLRAARKTLVVFCGVGVVLLIPTIFTANLYLITLPFPLATVSYASLSTIANVRPTDLYASDSVASVSGLSGTAAGIGTIIAFKLIGHFSDVRQSAAAHSFDPIVIVAALLPLLGRFLAFLTARH